MQGSALHKHRTFHIAISPCMNTLDQGEILLTCFLQSRLDAKNQSLTVRHPYSIGEGRGGFARQEAYQTLVWNEARTIC